MYLQPHVMCPWLKPEDRYNWSDRIHIDWWKLHLFVLISTLQTLHYFLSSRAEVTSSIKVLFQTTLYWTQQWKSSEPLVIDEEPLAHQPGLCYANSLHSMHKMTPLLPFLNKTNFILSFYCCLSCLQKAVIWQCLRVRVCFCAPEEKEVGVFCVWIPELCEKDRFLWGWI